MQTFYSIWAIISELWNMQYTEYQWFRHFDVEKLCQKLLQFYCETHHSQKYAWKYILVLTITLKCLHVFLIESYIKLCAAIVTILDLRSTSQSRILWKIMITSLI